MNIVVPDQRPLSAAAPALNRWADKAPRMIRRLILLGAVATASALAGDGVEVRMIAAVPVYIDGTNPVEARVDGTRPIFRNVLVAFSVTPSDSSPRSFIVAGKVVDNNAGAPQEGVPLFFGSPLHPPRLAALTNVDGEFRVRIWLKDDHRELRLQTPAIEDGLLYIREEIGRFSDPESLFKRMAAYSYSFRDLLAATGATFESNTRNETPSNNAQPVVPPNAG